MRLAKLNRIPLLRQNKLYFAGLQLKYGVTTKQTYATVKQQFKQAVTILRQEKKNLKTQ